MRKFLHTSVVASFSAVLLAGCLADGDVEGPPTEYDTSRLYYLPYEYGVASGVVQGYDGHHSHVGEYSLDFKMPVGSLILAAREGTVVEVVDVHSGNCPQSKNCSNNLIYINHDSGPDADGTQGRYLHIETGGACVKVGDKVQQGDVIALSGNVGISLIPHLHFQVVGASAPPTFVDVNEGGSGIPDASTSYAPMYASANQIRTDHCGAI